MISYQDLQDLQLRRMPATVQVGQPGRQKTFAINRIPMEKRKKTHARLVKLAAGYTTGVGRDRVTGVSAVLADPKGFELKAKADILGGLLGGIMSLFGPTLLAALLSWLIPVVIQWLTDLQSKPMTGGETAQALLFRVAQEAA